MKDNVQNDADEWAEGNRAGRERAAQLIKRMLDTGNPTLLLGECRNIEDPFYSAEGVGFFAQLAEELSIQ